MATKKIKRKVSPSNTFQRGQSKGDPSPTVSAAKRVKADKAKKADAKAKKRQQVISKSRPGPRGRIVKTTTSARGKPLKGGQEGQIIKPPLQTFKVTGAGASPGATKKLQQVALDIPQEAPQVVAATPEQPTLVPQEIPPQEEVPQAQIPPEEKQRIFKTPSEILKSEPSLFSQVLFEGAAASFPLIGRGTIGATKVAQAANVGTTSTARAGVSGGATQFATNPKTEVQTLNWLQKILGNKQLKSVTTTRPVTLTRRGGTETKTILETTGPTFTETVTQGSLAGFSKKLVVGLLSAGVVGALGTYPFSKFIKEEAIQTVSFGIKSSIEAGNFEGAERALALSEEIADIESENIIKRNIPYKNLWKAFGQFFDALRLANTNWRFVLEEERKIAAGEQLSPFAQSQRETAVFKLEQNLVTGEYFDLIREGKYDEARKLLEDEVKNLGGETEAEKPKFKTQEEQATKRRLIKETGG